MVERGASIPGFGAVTGRTSFLVSELGLAQSRLADDEFRWLQMRSDMSRCRSSRLLLALLLTLAAGCSGSAHSAKSPSVPVSATRSATLSLASGARVTVAKGSVTGSGRLTGSVVAAPGPAPAGMTLAGDVYRLE